MTPLPLAAPVGPADHVLGPAGAPETLVVYGDYECPYTRIARSVIRAAQRQAGDRLRYVFRNFPLEKHPHAFRAAEAAEAAGAQGKFWEMYELLFHGQQSLDDAHLASYAAQLGLDVGRFRNDLTAHVHAARIQADREGGLLSGVEGTPTYFINGTRRPDLEEDPQKLLAALRAGGE